METSKDTLSLLNRIIPKPEPLLESGDLLVILQGLAAVIFIGLLIGLEREFSRPKEGKIFAGIRTFPLIGILGFGAALIASFTDTWVYIAIFLGFSGLLVAAYLSAAKDGRLGGTSEVSGMLVFILGSLVYWGFILLPAIIAIITASFLSLKLQLHTFVGKINAQDIYATLKLAIISIIILPLLPDKTVGYLDVINPRLIWYMVILVSGISFIGYVLIKFYDKGKGIALTGLLGGMVSSTAVAFSLAKKSKKEDSLSNGYSVGIIIACTVMYFRILILVSLLNFSLFPKLIVPVIIFTITGLIVTFYYQRKAKPENYSQVELKNPLELKSAFLFGITFGVVLFLTKAAEVFLGKGGIYAASGLAGFTSVDAIVISIANLTNFSVESSVAVQAIIIAIIANTIGKILISVVWGSAALKNNIIKGLGLMAFVSIIYLVFLYI